MLSACVCVKCDIVDVCTMYVCVYASLASM